MSELSDDQVQRILAIVHDFNDRLITHEDAVESIVQITEEDSSDGIPPEGGEPNYDPETDGLETFGPGPGAVDLDDYEQILREQEHAEVITPTDPTPMSHPRHHARIIGDIIDWSF